MNSLRKVGMLIAVGLIVGGLAMEYGPLALRYIPGLDVAQPNAALIVRETALDKPLTKEQVKLFQLAPDFGVAVVDDDILGPGKQPSKQLQPFLDAAKGHELPVLVLGYPGGSVEVEPCPVTLEALKERIGNIEGSEK